MQYGTAAIVLVVVAVWVCSVADALAADDLLTRRLSKAAWVRVVLMLPVVGGLVWLVLGRPARQPRSGGPGFRPRSRVTKTGTDEFAQFVAGLRRATAESKRHR
jgi:hypothetical protein